MVNDTNQTLQWNFFQWVQLVCIISALDTTVIILNLHNICELKPTFLVWRDTALLLNIATGNQ